MRRQDSMGEFTVMYKNEPKAELYARSSVGRALDLQAGGCGFNPCQGLMTFLAWLHIDDIKSTVESMLPV